MKYAMTVDAWQVDLDDAMPIWVVQTWNNTGDGKLTHRCFNAAGVFTGTVKASPGEWIVKFPRGAMVAMNHEAFTQQFQPVPGKSET